MTITQLQYVLAVAEHKNFTLAAEKSFVTQPTLSMQVQKLEDELDILLFDRSKKPITITEVGKKIVEGLLLGGVTFGIGDFVSVMVQGYKQNKAKQEYILIIFLIIIFPLTFYPIYLVSKRLYKWIKQGFN